MSKAAYRGIVKDGAVVLEEAADLPDGAEVLGMPIEEPRGSPGTVLAAIDAPPHIDPEDVDELMRFIEEGKRPVHYDNPLTRKRKS
jgi:hypothetical protein